MGRAFVKLNRKTFDSWVWKDSGKFDKRSAYCDLLGLADYKSEQRFHKRIGKLKIYQRGTVYKSLQELALRWSWDRKTVRKFISDLQESGMVTAIIKPNYTEIKMLWYDEVDDEDYYDDEDDSDDDCYTAERTAERTEISLNSCGLEDNPWTADGQHNGQRMDSGTDTFKEVKEVKEIKEVKEDNMVIQKDDRPIAYDFEDWITPKGG